MTHARLLSPLLLLCAAPLAAAPAPTNSSPPGLAVAAPGTARYDFGARDLGDPAPLTHTFFLRNGSTAPVVVERLASSCHCTSAEPGGGRPLPVTVAPGASLPLRVTVQTGRLAPGRLSKTVRVFVRGAKPAALTLEVTGDLRASRTR